MSKHEADIVMAAAERERVIVRTSVIGILTNVLLAAFKAAVGLLSHSIAVILDAVNNLSDALSSVVTIIGAKLGAKQPDKKHPLGYGRIEYLSSMIVAAIVLYAGITSLVESVKKIITPEAADYSAVSLVIIGAAILAKLVLGTFVKKQGEKVHSRALVASGSDALFDAILSASVLASAVVYLLWGVSLEAYVGVVISGFIIKAGVEMMIETLDDIIGKRGDAEVSQQLKQIVCAQEQVLGAYDVTLFNYGPNRNYGSVHVELPDHMKAEEIDRLTRKLESKVYRETGIILVAVGLYSYNTGDDEASRIRNDVQERVLEHDWALQVHGFYVDTEAKDMRFDVVLTFGVTQKDALETLHAELGGVYPGYTISISPDVDVSVSD